MNSRQELFRCEVTIRDGRAIVAPYGELDLASVDELASHLDRAHTGDGSELVLDLRGLTFLDSTGVRLLVRWRERAQEEEFPFAVVQGPASIQRLLDVAGVSPLLRFVEPPAGNS